MPQNNGEKRIDQNSGKSSSTQVTDKSCLTSFGIVDDMKNATFSRNRLNYLQQPLHKTRMERQLEQQLFEGMANSVNYVDTPFNPFLGQLLLPRPNILKKPRVESNEHLTVCISSMQGWRLTMEDTNCLFLELPHDPTSTTLVGVFDGHGGINIADYVSRNLYKFIMRQPEYKDNIKRAITKGFIEIDGKMQKDRPEEQSGSTAVTIFIRNNTLYCSNIGDSRAIAYENGKITALSYDHKPTLPLEYKRIIESGGWVEAERVNGSLAISRAFGDYQFKTAYGLRPQQQMVSCVPDIVTKKLDRSWKFVVMASDGIWEVMTNQKVGDFVRVRLSEGMALEKICEALMSACIAPRCIGTCLGCDNMTVAIVVFKWPQ